MFTTLLSRNTFFDRNKEGLSDFEAGITLRSRGKLRPALNQTDSTKPPRAERRVVGASNADWTLFVKMRAFFGMDVFE